jgi:signal transduction histidine kinase
VFEDREGNIWLGTNMGLDRFTVSSVVVEPAVNPTSPSGYRMAPANDGGFYLIQSLGLYELGRDGRLTMLQSSGIIREGVCAGSSNTVWVTSQRGLDHWIGHTPHNVPLPEGVRSDRISACAEDRGGDLWLAAIGKGLLRRRHGVWSALAAFGDLPFDGPALLLPDPGGGMWVELADGPLRLVESDRVASFDSGVEPNMGIAEIACACPMGILAGSESGLTWFDGRRVRKLHAAAGSPFRRIAGIVQTGDGEVWLNTLSGVVAVGADDLRNAFLVGRWPEHYRLFDRRDGLPGLAQQDSYAPTALQGADGRLWFITNQGIAWIDPRRLPRNAMTPPVVIEDLIADGRHYPTNGVLDLPAGSSNIEIDYSALSLRIPERVAFRYLLEGVDKAWVDPGSRRQAFYTKLGAGDYVFRVIAANDSGKWNRIGAEIRFKIKPKLTEMLAFKVTCAFAALLLVAVLLLVYFRGVLVRLRERTEERLRERERIARELHDTLLQGFQGLQLHFQAVVEALPRGSAAERLEGALTLADDTLKDARLRVRDLRSTRAPGGLADHVRLQGERLLSGHSMTLEIVEPGRRRALDAGIEREVATIAEESIFNSVKHASASVIVVSITYGWRRFEMTVSDNGRGFAGASAPTVPGQQLGIIGMRERARRMRGTLDFANASGGGARVRLVVPGVVAYETRSWLTSALRIDV